ncbi:thylakoid membrane photosystem I accumulation factor [Leptolyngbya sp. FACHB-711]|uniref:thylakoid membrane photosystem I accumulation factor n=1 Tax=unclassified Leptolyngbya TaxID=2650499 RepID=UPI00168240E3|nr:thylakoid membrane photosystem I accumulation factor [Leptolyngbya sp. FACHB-711]MBD1853886.1 thylakoid membrane photosystem I accumulation factor [Cyanobacteria bacterium FACHB-502]MBD2024321.1 thylakoid membrane photosystem I accumulation factor [Leptolyngbya sp. FACHB-711]
MRFQFWQPSLTRRSIARLCLSLLLGLVIFCAHTAPASALLTDDRFDGNIFPLYAGNGSLVPPNITLAEAFKNEKPTLLMLYTDDSLDCKEYALVVSRIDGLYGWAMNMIALSVDPLPLKDRYRSDEPGYYYKGYVPQTVIFDQSNKIVLNEKGSISLERIDDVLREVFNLLPRSESTELRRRPVNEISTELAP